jgi:hypothetical protein
MAFTGRLGKTDSQLGNIVLGEAGVADTSFTFTADAYIVWPVVFQDDFNRTAGILVGPASHKGNWGLPHGYGSQFGGSVNGSAWEVAAYPAEGYVSLGTLPYRQEVYFEFNAATDTYLFYSAPAYFNGVDYTYANFELYEDTPGDWLLNVGAGSNISAPITTGVTHSVRAYLDPEGNAVKVKVWETGDPEPASWTDEDTCTTSPSYISDLTTSTIYFSWWTGDGTDPKTIDNITVYANDPSGAVGLFTADAILQKTTAGSFTADAYIDNGGVGTTVGSFTADALLYIPNVVGSFTANALLKKTTTGTFTANARLVNRTTGTFTADAYFSASRAFSFTANAYLVRPAVVSPNVNHGGWPRIHKRQTMNVLQHRERPLPTFVPPRTPSDDDVPDDGPGGTGPGCLPPCPGAGAGYGTGFGTNGGAIVTTITKCSNLNNYWNSGENYLGKGAVSFAAHCGSGTSHSYASHINRMFITYTNMPTSKFRMRAKMVWDIGATTSLTVNVYAAAMEPDILLDECDGTADYWDSGMLVGKLNFVADGDGSIGERDVWYQANPSELVLDAGAIGGNTFRFALSDESNFYRGEFKAANVTIVTD